MDKLTRAAVEEHVDVLQAETYCQLRPPSENKREITS